VHTTLNSGARRRSIGPQNSARYKQGREIDKRISVTFRQQVQPIFYQKNTQNSKVLAPFLNRLAVPVRGVLLGLALLSTATLANAGQTLTVAQGLVGQVSVAIAPGDSAPWGSFRGELVHFKKSDAGQFVGLVGVDMEAKLGDHPLEIRVLRGGVSTQVARPIVQVVAGHFGVQHLTLPDKMVTLSDATLTRVGKEKAEVRALWASKSNPTWRPDWQMPLAGDVSGSFGKRRVINGEPRNPHNGEDIPAPTGTPVLAPNNGIARLAKERFFGGQTVFLEHGGGLFTFYMHLSEIDVVDGQAVAAGDLIGKVGASGRATGPHLHWGGRLNNARINPVDLVSGTSRLHIDVSTP